MSSLTLSPLTSTPTSSPLTSIRSLPAGTVAPVAPASQDSLKLTAKRPVSALRDGILFLGFNPASANELKTLRGVSSQLIELRSENGKSGSFDLDQAAGRAGFVSSLGLDAGRSARLLKLLDQADPFGRDELAELAKIWNGAEKGGDVPGRMVLSGHCDGLKIWGESGRGSLTLGEIGRLADVFPAAAAQIEDLHLSGCNTGYRSNASFWREHFPNLKTFWGYTHTAPSSVYASPAHLKTWEAATRGATAGLNRAQLQQSLKNAARSGNLAIWSQQGDYQSSLPPKAISGDDLRQLVERFRLGEETSSDSQNGPLKQAYDQLQSLRGEAGDSSYDELIGKALRLRFYGNLALNFQQAYGEILNQAFAELQLAPADFGKLERRDALQVVKQFRDAFSTQRGSLDDAQIERLEKVKTLLYHFENMNPDFFAAEWIDPLTPASLGKAREDFDKLQPLPQWPLFPGLGAPGLWPGFGGTLGNLPTLGQGQAIGLPLGPINLGPAQGLNGLFQGSLNQLPPAGTLQLRLNQDGLTLPPGQN